jgi:hypothetical protein
MNFVGIITFLAGALICGTSLPLVYRKVPMNQLYGIRISESFKSPERWYEVNEYGGRKLAKWSILLMISGLAGFFVPAQHMWSYIGLNLAITFISLIVPVAQTFIWARKKS